MSLSIGPHAEIPVYLSTYLSVPRCIQRSICLYARQSLSLPMYRSICPSTVRSDGPPLQPADHPIHMSIALSVDTSICMPIGQDGYRSIRRSIYPPIHPPSGRSTVQSIDRQTDGICRTSRAGSVPISPEKVADQMANPNGVLPAKRDEQYGQTDICRRVVPTSQH